MLRIHRGQRPMMLELLEIEDLGVSCLVDQAGNGNILTREEFEKLAAEMQRFYQLIEDQKIEIVINREFPEPSVPGPSPKKKGSVYLMKSVEGYKIGMSANPKARLSSMKSHAPSIELIHTFEADDALMAERYLHDRFSSLRISGEWFDLAPEDVERFKGVVGFKDDRFLESEAPI